MFISCPYAYTIDDPKRKEIEMNAITATLFLILMALLRLALPFGLLLYLGERNRRNTLRHFNRS